MATTLTTNNSLTKEAFISITTNYLHHVTRRYNKMDGRERLKNVMLDVERYARYNDEDGIGASYGWTAYAVRWSIDTLRLNQAPELALNAMNVRTLLTLVFELHQNCPTQIDVTRYLNSKF
jgi:hypothetical protein